MAVGLLFLFILFFVNPTFGMLFFVGALLGFSTIGLMS
jgi:hypothetical protein